MDGLRTSDAARRERAGLHDAVLVDKIDTACSFSDPRSLWFIASTSEIIIAESQGVADFVR
jgi:hypothetical protein